MNINTISRFFILLCLLAGSVFAQEVDEDTTVIALFGDSLSTGENITSWYENDQCVDSNNPAALNRAALEGRPGVGGGRFDFCNPDQELQRILEESGRKVIVVNHGIGGSQTFEGTARIQGDLNQTKAQFPGAKEYIVLINYGTNDLFAGSGISFVLFNLEEMIRRARAVGWTPVVSNMLPRTDHFFSSPGGPNDQIRASVLGLNAPFVDLFTSVNLGSPDFDNEVDVVEFFFGVRVDLFLHPSAIGYRKIAQRWFDQALEQLIEPQSSFVIAPILLLLDDEPEMHSAP